MLKTKLEIERQRNSTEILSRADTSILFHRLEQQKGFLFGACIEKLQDKGVIESLLAEITELLPSWGDMYGDIYGQFDGFDNTHSSISKVKKLILSLEPALASHLCSSLKVGFDLVMKAVHLVESNGNDEVVSFWLKEMKEIKSQLMIHNTRYVESFVRSRNIPDSNFDDLVNEGILGVMRAVEKFDVFKGTCFSTYYVAWVKNNVNRANRKIKNLFGQGEVIDRSESKVWYFREEFKEKNRRSPTLEEISKGTGIKSAKITELDRFANRSKSSVCDVSEFVGSFDKDMIALDFNYDLVTDIFNRMPSKERKFTERLYGLNNKRIWSKDVFLSKGMTEEEYERNVEQSHRSLKEMIASEGLCKEDFI